MPKDERSELVERYISGRGGHDSGCAFYRQGYGCNCRVAHWRDAFAAGLDAALEPQAGEAWDELKRLCCSDPPNARRCVMVDEEQFRKAIAALTPSEQGSVVRLREALREPVLEATLARLNWQKYNSEQGDEIVYQAEKMASAIAKIDEALR